ncbi:required for meiotic nuclear division protein 1 homolog [Megachile rotundata]|uniref:required for meiotic nuclear division protein 1 homolog n=1 Tax=Megachile rotundata TaxID=143995 RepID=UPI003FD00FE6
MNFITIQRCIILTCKSNINFSVCKKFSTISFNKVFTERVLITKSNLQLNQKNLYTSALQFNTEALFNKPQELKNKKENNYPVTHLKKRPKKRKSLSADKGNTESWSVRALSTSEEYNLEDLVKGLLQEQLYEPHTITTSTSSLPDVIHAVAKYQVEHEPREIFFFREGTVVMWNISDLESENILNFLKQYEENCYMATIVQSESEMMCYSYADNGKQSRIKDGNIVLGSNATNLDKFTFSNAMAQSVKLGIWEASLDIYINSIEFVTEDLKAGRKLQLTRQEVLKKQGELFALRHLINLSSDLLDVPDFYWERDDLEQLYQQICSYFNIAKRTRVINEKLNHCVELVSILSAHLSDRHHIRLEWMIIVLIMVEVVFETLHYMDRYFS